MAVDPLIVLAILALALVLDRLFGEPKRLHPLVGFGWLASAVERRLNRPLQRGVLAGRLCGALALGLLLLIPVLGIYVLIDSVAVSAPIELTLSILLLYLTIGARSLAEHAVAVVSPLRQGDLAQARVRVSYLVSRETQAMDEAACCGATIESVLENGSDSIVAPLFWFALGSVLGVGAAAAVGYRIINTLDAMWGYRSERYNHFGWAAAKLDDLANYLPARLCALSYALAAGSYRGLRRALRCWQLQGKKCESPNAGPVMASGAAALHIELGGAARYRGQLQQRPLLGSGAAPVPADVDRSLALLNRAIALTLLAIGTALLMAQQLLQRCC